MAHLFRTASCVGRSLCYLVERLVPVKRSVLARIAEPYLHPCAQDLDPRFRNERLEPAEIMDLLGGMARIRALRENAALLVEAAYYVVSLSELAANGYQNSKEAKDTVEQLGMQKRELTRWVWQLEFWRFLPTRGPWNAFYAERIVTLYYLMAERLLALYKVGHAGLVPDLERALFQPETA